MSKDPIFTTIMFYWLSFSFSLFGMLLVAFIIAALGFIAALPVKIYYRIKRTYNERRVRS